MTGQSVTPSDYQQAGDEQQPGRTGVLLPQGELSFLE